MSATTASANVSEDAQALLRRLEWTVLRRLDGLLQGDYRTLWRGGGLDLADLREYQHGDDVRHIDWNVTARLQIPHVRQYTEDRELSAWFLLDLSGSVDFGSSDRTKLAVSEGFVASLSRLLTRHGNRVGAVFYGQGAPGQASAVLPPRVGRNQVLQLITRMRQRPPRMAGQQTVLSDLLQRAGALIKRRSLVFVVSDFISEPGWAEPLARLAQRHEVLAVRLYDAAELALPDVGLMTLEDAESGEQLLVDTQAPGFLARFEALAGAHEAELRGALARAGVDTLELATDDDLMAALLRFVALRRQRLRAQPGHRLPATLRPAEPAAPRAAATA
jgi:uncharacterized protein (DUF58 family)